MMTSSPLGLELKDLNEQHTEGSSPTSPPASGAGSSNATATTAREKEEREDEHQDSDHASTHGAHDTEEQEDSMADQDDVDARMNEHEHKAPRQGLPSFWHALRRLDPKEPRSIIHSFNFFRWHVIVGLFVPLITAGFFLACNTETKFAYIDALFMCTSALTLTGLSSILLADMSFGQQFILYLLLQFGSIQFVSLLVLFVRRAAFSKRFDPHRSFFPHKSMLMEDEEMKIANGVLNDPDETPVLDEEGKRCEKRHTHDVKCQLQGQQEKRGRPTKKMNDGEKPTEIPGGHSRKMKKSQDEFAPRRMHSPVSMKSADYVSHPFKNSTALRDNPPQRAFTIIENTGASTSHAKNTSTNRDEQLMRQRTRMNTTFSGNTGTSSSAAGKNGPHKPHYAQSSARGGFPNPVQAIFSEGVYQLKKATARPSGDFDLYTGVPGAGLNTSRSVRMGTNTSLADPQVGRSSTSRSGFSRRAKTLTEKKGSGGEGGGDPASEEEATHKSHTRTGKAKQVSLPASAYRFGRNSTVRDLSKEAHQKLAQLEISGMTLLMYIIVVWWIGLQLFFVIIWSPYFSAGHFDSVFQQYNPDVSKTWFSVFQSASMLNNCGLSLIDGSLTPFRTCYIMLVPAVFLIVVGNLGYPISLRFTVWLLHKSLHYTSKLRFITSFTLAHPRRIFFYIFPPYETYALLIIVTILTTIDWVCFFILDIGFTSPVFSISTGSAVISGLVQSVAVRSAGFYTIPLYQVAPALDMLYLFMMAFCIYPLALAIRATNVYEERSLGIQEEETTLATGLTNLRREKGYSKFHFREQLAYDVWYILLAFWLICIVERNNIGITGADAAGSIDMFALLFEVTSAYANVGFSIGTPTSDTSIAGGLRHLSKLILCVTMLRGRTRGLPVLVDRAVLTPRQLERHGDPAEGGGDDDQAAGEAEQEAHS